MTKQQFKEHILCACIKRIKAGKKHEAKQYLLAFKNTIKWR